MLGAGDCLHIEMDNVNKDGKRIGHLFVILFDGEPYTGNTIIVPIDTYRTEKHDKTVMLQSGDHEFIKFPSFVNYSLAKTTSIAYINQLIKDGKIKHKPSVTQAILSKIREGVRKSKRTKNEILIAYSNQMDKELRNN